MSDVTTLKCWPSCVCAIDWSSEGILALASSEQVELLFPNIESEDSDKDVPQWRHFPLQVPWFTKDELPPKQSTPSQIFSAGEEISTSYVLGIGWSPTGLAKHRRCALAVLTSNLVLSIWASDGKPQDEPSWERTLVVNDALKKYFATNANEVENTVVSDSTDRWRLRQRVRAFAWAPALPTERHTGTLGTSPPRRPCLIAVSNDDNQIVLVAVKSPTSELGAVGKWSPEVVCHFPSSQDPVNIAFDSYTFDEMMDEQRHALHLTWSPWTPTADGLHCVLAYATNKDVRLRKISFSHGNVSVGPEVMCPDCELRFAGPISWSPDVRDGQLVVALFATKEVIFLTISTADASIVNQQSHHLDGRWDAISGVVWDSHHPDHYRVHFSSNTMTTSCPTAVLELSPTGIKDVSTSEGPYWREHISGSQGLFSAKHNLKGHANAKVWGLAVSPLGEFIASCHTVHPTDMIEYGTPADRRTMIAISDLWSQGTDLVFPEKEVTTEGIFFSARKWIEKNIETPDDLPPVKEDMHLKLIKAYIPAQDSSTSAPLSYEPMKLEVLTSAFKQNVFMNPNTMKDRFEILASSICTPSESTELPRMLIAFRLAKAVLGLASVLSDDEEYSQAILDTHRQLVHLVEDIMSEPEPDAEGEVDDEAEGALFCTPEPEPPSLPRLIGAEKCVFCDAAIPFSDVSTAVCTNGHEFVRCGLSFLAIQSPGCTKKCGICSTPFLAEDIILEEQEVQKVPSSQKGPEDDMELDSAGEESGQHTPAATDQPSSVARKGERKVPVTLARVLFLACDACIYCGGKFVG